MQPPLSVFAITFGVTLAAMAAVWVLSLVKRDASIVDVFWGLGFVLIGVVSHARGGGPAARQWLVTTLVTLWGVRLALYLLWRNWGGGEDYRYQAMRKHYGARFPWVSLYLVFGLQGVLMWIVSLPIQMAQASPLPVRLGALDAIGTLLWSLGLAFEAVGDWQLARFKRDPANKGNVMDRGLWAYTRHPNYFGDTVLWWGIFTIALATPHGGWTVIGPIVMTYLLMRLSGVPLLERRLMKTRPEYADYVRRTSAFVPRPTTPRGGRASVSGARPPRSRLR